MIRSRPRIPPRLLLVLAAVAVSVLGLVGPAAAATPYCGITWGSQPEHSGDGYGPAGSFVTGVRSGQHECFDRLVVDLGEAGGFSDYDVRYVPQLQADGSGQLIPVRGGAVLQVIVRVPAYDEYGATYYPANPREVVDTTGYATFRQVAWAGSFEGSTTLGIGTRALLPFRVLVLEGPPGSGQDMRLVIDVAAHW